MDFNIIEDKGNYKHWEYTAEYTEFLSNFPSIKNKAVGKFIVKPEGNEYAIYSTHNTCFFNAYCCKSSILSCSKLFLILLFFPYSEIYLGIPVQLNQPIENCVQREYFLPVPLFSGKIVHLGGDVSEGYHSKQPHWIFQPPRTSLKVH